MDEHQLPLLKYTVALLTMIIFGYLIHHANKTYFTEDEFINKLLKNEEERMGIVNLQSNVRENFDFSDKYFEAYSKDWRGKKNVVKQDFMSDETERYVEFDESDYPGEDEAFERRG